MRPDDDYVAAVEAAARDVHIAGVPPSLQLDEVAVQRDARAELMVADFSFVPEPGDQRLTSPDGRIHDRATREVDATFLRMSGFSEPALYAETFWEQVQLMARESYENVHSGPVEPLHDGHVARARDVIPSAELLWAELLEMLRRLGSISTSSTGHTELVVHQRGYRVTFMFGPGRWREYLVAVLAQDIANGWAGTWKGGAPGWALDEVAFAVGNERPFVTIEGARMVTMDQRGGPRHPVVEG